MGWHWDEGTLVMRGAAMGHSGVINTVGWEVSTEGGSYFDARTMLAQEQVGRSYPGMEQAGKPGGL